MRAKRIAAFLAAIAILVALGPPTGATAAKPTHRVREPASVEVQANGRADNGFHFSFFTLPGTDDLLLSQGLSHTAEQSVSYFVRRRGDDSDFEGDRLDARIGGLGHFRARFVTASTKTQEPPQECTGDLNTIEKGYFVGSFSFRGEHGYTTIHSHREHGTVTRQGATSCLVPTAPHRPARPTKEERGQEERELHFVAGDSSAHLAFQAQRDESKVPEESPLTIFLASSYSQVGRLTVSHDATVFDIEPGSPEAFLIPSLAEATLAPPAPFSGSAAFHLEGPHEASWTGDLAVELPGLGTVPLTGGDIEAGLCNGASHCTKTVSKTLKKVLENSSESDSSSYVSGEATTEPAS